MSDGTNQPGTTGGISADDDSFFENGALKSKFVDRQHMEPMAEGMAKDGLNMSQLNRFFRHCRRIQFRLKRKEIGWDKVRSEVELLCAHAADAYGKGQKIPESFKRFIDSNVKRIHTEKDFIGGFMKHFEALMGFASLYAKKGQRG
jgi:CRISPR type III-A-associated protein Csm2